MSGQASTDLKNKKTKSSGHGGARPNAGRPKGVPNKLTTDVKEMILAALNGAGGADYLQRQANENPASFMTLVGKVLPMTVAGDKDAPIEVRVTRRIVGGAE